MAGKQQQALTRSMTSKEAADKLAAEEAKPWDQRLNEVILEIQKIIPSFKGRYMCTACKRDTIDHTPNTVCSQTAWPKDEADRWQEDYHQQLVETLAKINNEKIMTDMADMKEKRKSAQAACESFETNLNHAINKIAVMEAYVEECKGDRKIAEEQETKIKKQYSENMDELSMLREQAASWRRGSEVEVRQRRGSSAESEVFRIKRERDNTTLKQNHQEAPGQVRNYRRTSTTGQPPNSFNLTGQGISKEALLKVLPRMTIHIKEEKDISKFMGECDNLRLEASIVCGNLNNQNLIEIFYFRAEGMIKIAASAIINQGYSFEQFTQQIMDQVFLGGSAGFRNKFLTLKQEKFETLPQYLARFKNHCRYQEFEPQEWSQIFIEGIRSSEGKMKLKGQNYRKMNLEDICVYLDTQREERSGEYTRPPTGAKPSNIDKMREKERWTTLRPSRNNPARRESKKVMKTNEQSHKNEDGDQERGREEVDRFRNRVEEREEREQRELEDFPETAIRMQTLELDAFQCAYCSSKDHQAKDCEDEDRSCRFCDGPHPLLFCRRYWKQKAADERDTDPDL
jgi:hypothetical protein